MKKTIKKRKIALVAVFAILLVLVVGSVVYVNDAYASEDVSDALATDEMVQVEQIKEGYYFDGPGTEEALVFYPGAKVEYTAYAPLLRQISEEGIDCFLVQMPGNLAMFGQNKAEDIMKQYPYEKWYLSGHSLGGAMAASFAGKHVEELDGLILLAAYSTADLQEADFPVLLIYGDQDKVLNQENFTKCKNNLPEASTIVVIAGGNHAKFGNYGKQDGDGEAKISAGQQQEQVVKEIKSIFP